LLARLADSNNEQFGQAYFKASRRIRDVINGLRPDTLEHFGLKVALKELWVESKAYARETSTHIESELEGGLFRYPQDVEINLFRIVQQALNNALKHAQADRIEILGRLEESWLELSVVDDGVGFDAKGQDLLALLVRRNYGILTMYERANSIGAGLKIESTPGKGTCITVRWQVNGG
jgi:signal transduction histidine kinase